MWIFCSTRLSRHSNASTLKGISSATFLSLPICALSKVQGNSSSSTQYIGLLSFRLWSYLIILPILKIPFIVMDLDFYFDASFRSSRLSPFWLADEVYVPFLRYYGPKRLRGAHRVLLDDDGFQITHIGQGAFAVIVCLASTFYTSHETHYIW